MSLLRRRGRIAPPSSPPTSTRPGASITCWTLTNGGTVFGSYSATFNYGNGSDVDGGATPANFIAEKYDGSTWSSPLTLSGTPSGTGATVTGVTSMSDFAVGESKVTPTLSVTNSPVTYNGSQQAAVVIGSVAGTVSDIKYDGSSTAPTNEGTYAVTADFAPDDPVQYKHLNDASAGTFGSRPSQSRSHRMTGRARCMAQLTRRSAHLRAGTGKWRLVQRRVRPRGG